MRKISPAGVVSMPALAWGVPNLTGLAYYKGMLYKATRNAILQTAVD